MKSIPFNVQNIDEQIDTLLEISKIINTSNSNDGFINFMLNVFISKVTEIELIKQVDTNINPQNNSLGDNEALLKEKDNKRDSAFVGFKNFIKAHSFHPEENVEKLAKSVIDVIKKHGFMVNKPDYQAKSADMELLITELQSEKVFAAITTLGAEPWFEKMIKAKTEYEEVLNSSKKANKTPIPDTTLINSQIARYFDGLYNYIDLMAGLLPEKYSELLSKVEEVFEKSVKTVDIIKK